MDASLAGVDKNEIWRDLFYKELTTGLRRGEICGLMWKDFDENAGTLKILRSVNAPKRGELEIGETKTDQGLGNEVAEESSEAAQDPLTNFQPVMRRIRKPGGGCITQLNDHLFQGPTRLSGRTTPSTPNVSAPTPVRSARRS